jgi:hypothetical protein
MEEPKVSCFQVFKKLCCVPRHENIFWSALKPLLWCMAAVTALGALYLWCVPLTNVMGQVLFADFKCYAGDSIWGVCGKTYDLRGRFDPNGTGVVVGFLVFLMIQSSMGALVIATTLYMSSRYYGRLYDYPQRMNGEICCASCFSDAEDRSWYWIPRDLSVDSSVDNEDATWCGAYLQINSIGFAIFGIFCLTIYIGVWGGRAIAMQVHHTCIPYKATQLGFYGCVDAAGAYVGGDTCRNCAGIGFAILGLPLFFLHLLIPLLWICFRRIYKAYRKTKRDLQEIAAQNAEQKTATKVTATTKVTAPTSVLSTISATDVTLEDEFSAIPPLFVECPVCLDRAANVKLTCNHEFCKVCVEKLQATRQACPICRKWPCTKEGL